MSQKIIKGSFFSAWKEALMLLKQEQLQKDSFGKRAYHEAANLQVMISSSLPPIERLFHYFAQHLGLVYPCTLDLEQFILKKTLGPGFKYSYGNRLFSYGTKKLNQIDEYVIPLLLDNPSSKRATAMLWYPSVDAKAYKQDTPSLVLIHFKIRNQKLFVTAVTRSMDFLFGWPAHCYQLSILQRYVYQKVALSKHQLALGSITTITFSAMLYQDHEPLLEELFVQTKKLAS
ncbi:MAG: thymidylate synthase [Candidatus Woesearchaeota archaeon]